ncbi:MAG: 2,4-dihydroxyhept-2-ene-1,7-dioic acid aldolase [Tateyamaria sp.]|jgi:4-hydroxy-2-oxoheptanedioate aldolase|nr:2,4-dihydroxyhept-2-ene-1,7-dioic acid aldolase [Tateyamaria sp.]MBT5302584.1 2,4-dihydroxyhept-2-ene-1,7-dioic acid aldolase [Tateyamaria sp.]MBT6268138.1 2,4-dihydroxyhept-2-ene-1,7-dioic acid aldolase [Tateyamaria sp.]MBT6344165.1 2,4-dihydroxyhept-2-ene-1,7-dioic acid aldolase [Tateyamaria sp.]MBT7448828.1 2,4-dihydroxyhept-2-ene-1,7-dioic acid aldolase [Tateyamaria sp.]
MQKNKLKKLWAAGQPAMNGWCSIGNPFTAEIMAAQGYDSLTIDIQHGALDYGDALPMLQAMKASGATLMARVPWRDPTYIMKALDAGAMGIICPMINNRSEAEEFVSYMRYPPHGQRSFGPTRAAVAIPGYSVAANEEVLALAMIETADGVENLDEIAATPGLDGIYVGPADLTLGTQHGRLSPGFDRNEPEMIVLIKQIAQICKTNKIVACLHCGTPEYAAESIGWGYQLTTVSGDTRLLASAASNSVAEWRNLVGRNKQSSNTEEVY